MTKILFVAGGDHLAQMDTILELVPYEVEQYMLTPWSDKRLPGYLRAHGDTFDAVGFPGHDMYGDARQKARLAYRGPLFMFAPPGTAPPDGYACIPLMPVTDIPKRLAALLEK